MCEIRQNRPECRRPYPPLTHFSHSLWFFYLICLLQTTQTNLVQGAQGHAYSDGIRRWVRRTGTGTGRVREKREKEMHPATQLACAGKAGAILLWGFFHPVQQSSPHLSFNSSPFPVTMVTYLSLLPSYPFFPPLLSHSSCLYFSISYIKQCVCVCVCKDNC